MLDNRFLHTQHGFSEPMQVLRILQSKSNIICKMRFGGLRNERLGYVSMWHKIMFKWSNYFLPNKSRPFDM